MNIRLIYKILFFEVGLLLCTYNAFPQQNPIITGAYALLSDEADYTIPSITELRRRLKAAEQNTTTETLAALQTALNQVKDKNMPYNVVMNLYQDPTSKMAFTWFTNAGITGGKVQIVAGTYTTVPAFEGRPLIKDDFSTTSTVSNWNYNASANNLNTEAGITNNTKKSYTINKVLAQGLSPNTTYSFRVGKAGYWSEIGTFKTAAANNNTFSFAYSTDAQAKTYNEISKVQIASHAAFNSFSDAAFWLHCGDVAETVSWSTPSLESEWEWEQFFETQQDLFYKYPFAPVLGNHDTSPNGKFGSHFNIFENVDYWKSVYSFEYGDALFIAINSESYDYNANGFVKKDLIPWMQTKVAQTSKKWKIVYFHKAIYSGAAHQTYADAKTWRENMAPYLDQMGIDVVLQGHDHSYAVIGPVNNYQLVAGSVTNQVTVTPVTPGNLTGKLGGIYNTYGGTLYFINGSSGVDQYTPNSLSSMSGTSFVNSTGLANYSTLFTGRFGKTNHPSFSKITVSTDTIFIATYEMNNGTSVEFDKIKVVKSNGTTTYNIVSSVTGGNGTITPSGTTSVNHGSNRTYTITPSTGYHIAQVLVDGVNNPAAVSGGTYTFTNVTATHTIVASFAIDTYNIVSSVTGGNGTITPSGTTSVNHGSNRTYTITPSTGYHIAQVLVDGVNNPAAVSSGTYTFTNVTAPHTIVASFAINTYNIVSSVTGGNGTITPSGTTSVNHGSNQTYTITPDAGYHIAQVLVDGVNNPVAVSSGTYSFTNVTVPHTIVASFAINTYNIVSSVTGGNGIISPSGTTYFVHDESQTYTITPDAGYHIAQVLVDDVNDPTAVSNGTYTFTNITAPHTIVASFAINSYTVAISANPFEGNVDGGGSYNYGTTVTVTATANTGYIFVNWTNEGTEVSTDVHYDFIATEDVSLVANFTVKTYTITSSITDDNGTITPIGITSVNHGGSQSYTITPNTGYQIAQVLVDGEEVSGSTFSFTNVIANHTIVASFVKNMYNITISPKILLLAIGESVPLKATITPVDGINQNISWSSNQPEIATVDQNGLVTGVSEGTATITVTLVNLGVTSECLVTVLSNDASIAGIWVNDVPSVLSSEDNTTYEITVDFTDNITITASVNHQAATIDDNYLGIKPVETGKNIFKIVVTAEDGNTKEYTLEVTVNGLINSDIMPENSKIMIYPNPASEIITVSGLEGHGILTIFDATGRQMMKREITSPIETISVNTLPEGIYFVQIVEGKKVNVIKIVILKI